MKTLSLPKYAQAKQNILSYIGEKGLKNGEKLPSEKELSVILNVSMITLRRALHELESSEIIERVQGKGTFIKSQILNGEKLGVVTFLAVDQWTYPLPEQLEKLRQNLYRRGYGLRYYVTGKSPDNVLLNEIVHSRGVLISGWVTDEWISFLEHCGLPTIAIGSYPLKSKVRTVSYNWIKAAEILVQHFVAKGIRKIGLITGAPTFYPSQEMFTGFQKAVKESNLPYSDSFVLMPKDQTRYREISEFIMLNHDRLDAILVQEGSFLSTLLHYWEQDYSQHPYLGLLSEDSCIGPDVTRVVGTKFAQGITETAVELLFATKDQKEFIDQHVLIDPFIG